MRLIDADTLLKEVENEQKYLIARGQLSEEHILVHTLKRPVLDAPAISVGTNVQDAFMDGYRYRDCEIVRCGECIHWETDWTPNFAKSDNEHYCHCIDLVRCADWYCKDGDRRSE